MKTLRNRSPWRAGVEGNPGGELDAASDARGPSGVRASICAKPIADAAALKVPLSVLVVDDLLRPFQSQLLERDGWRVSRATSRVALLGVLAQIAPTALDAVLLSLELSELGGSEAIVKIHLRLPMTPIVAISGAHASADDAVLAIELGASAHLRQTGDSAAIAHAVDTWGKVKRERERRPRGARGEAAHASPAESGTHSICPPSGAALPIAVFGSAGEWLRAWAAVLRRPVMHCRSGPEFLDAADHCGLAILAPSALERTAALALLSTVRRLSDVPALLLLDTQSESDAREASLIGAGYDAGAAFVLCQSVSHQSIVELSQRLLGEAAPAYEKPQRVSVDDTPLVCGSLRIENRVVYRDGEVKPLSDCERARLRVLMLNEGRVVAQETFERLENVKLTPGTMRESISQIRRAIGDDHKEIILTKHGEGWGIGIAHIIPPRRRKR
jgi:DNA-binding response OmpR family regulator